MLESYAYWSSTATAVAVVSGLSTKRDYVKQAQVVLGYSADHLVSFMIVVKILGPVAILARLSVPLSDLAYADIFYHLILSGMAHLGVRNPKGPCQQSRAWCFSSSLSSRKTLLARLRRSMRRA